MQPYAIMGVVNLSDMMTYLGIEDGIEREDFTDHISAVTWGDASYTLISVHRFWELFVLGSPVKAVAADWSEWRVFAEGMGKFGARYVNLEE